jgi:WD40 repeat protein
MEQGPGPRRLRYVGDYELLEELARGGMGIVYRARQISLNRLVAVKMIRAGLFAGDGDVQRFHIEAEVAASLDHPNIVPLYEVGEHAGQQYFSMKLIEGRSLASLVEGGCGFTTHCPNHREGIPRIPGRRRCCASAARLVAKAARAVHHAHQRGILHRDLKPGNILVDAAGEPHVTDFGLAKCLVDDPRSAARTPHLTLSGAVLGTPSYLAPEQATGQVVPLTTAADIYGLGAILYEMLTGRPPFQAATALETLRLVADEEPARPRRVNAFVDPDLEAICLKCLEKDPRHRYGSADALAEDLERWLRHEPIRARPSSPARRLMKWMHRRPAQAATLVALVGAVLLGATGVLWQWRVAARALQQSQESLWRANWESAHALRTSRQMGQRVKALEAIRAAAAIRPTPELRAEAIAALALMDLAEVGAWRAPPTPATRWTTNAALALLALGRPDGVIEIRSLGDGRLTTLLTNGQRLPDVRFNDKGDWLVGDDRVQWRLWDWQQRRLLAEVAKSAHPTLSGDWRWLAYADSASSVAWRDVRSEHVAGRLTGFKAPPGPLLFSPTNDLLMVALDTECQVWRLDDRKLIGSRTLPAAATGAWQPGEPVLALGCDDSHLYVWDVARDQMQTLTGHLREAVWPAFHPGGRLLMSGAWDHVLRFWDPYAGIQLLETTFADSGIFTPDGQWLEVQTARGVGRIEVHLSRECRLFHPPLRAYQNFGVTFSPDDRFLAGTWANDLWLWDVASGQRVAHQPLPGADGVQFISPRSLVTSSGEGVLLWTNTLPADGWAPARLAVVVPGGGDGLAQASLDVDRTRLVVRRGSRGEVYDFPSGQLRFALEGQPLLDSPQFSPDGRWLASGYWDNIGGRRSALWIWSAEDGRPVRLIPNGNGGPLFSADGRWLLVASEKEYFQYAITGHPTNWVPVRQYARDINGFSGGPAAISADSRWLAIQADQRIFRLVEVATGRELARFTPLPDAYRTGRASFSHNGRWLAISSDLGLHVWDLQLVRQRLRDMGLDWE